jgi:hypothetical protein
MIATWTHEQRALFENDWNDDTWLFQMGKERKEPTRRLMTALGLVTRLGIVTFLLLQTLNK